MKIAFENQTSDTKINYALSYRKDISPKMVT